jgi:pimeloyl-ACP methyl ester carboxylesterase
MLIVIRYSSKLQKRTAVALFIISIICILFSFISARSKKTEKSFGLKSHYINNSNHSGSAILVSEFDQVKTGAFLIPLIDTLFDKSEADKLRKMIYETYSEMQSDSDFVNAGSALNYAYSEILGIEPKHEHTYVYTPPHDLSDKLPVILFLHGSLGNFKLYMWILKQFADKYKYAIVAPTFGAGNWDRDINLSSVENARKLCIADPNLDEENLFIAGLSNGGIGVTRAVTNNPELYQGIIFISAVIDYELTDSEKFINSWKKKPILVIHGARDDRIPIEFTNEIIENFEAKELNFTFDYFENEDHFLMLSRKDTLSNLIYEWIEKNKADVK